MLVPLSEDERLSLAAPRELYLLEGERQVWDEVTVIGPRERRSISLDIRVETRAKGQMIRIFEVPEGARLTIYHNVKVAEGAHWQNVVCVRGKGEIRIRRVIEVFGADAQVQLACLGVMEQSGRISVADEIFTYAPRVKNEIRTKIVLNHQAQSEARGRIVLSSQAAGSESYERLDHLVFGDKTNVVVIPELEVYVDNVKSGHGATTSQPDEDEMFYLASRGLSPSLAQQLLAKGFISAAVSDFSPATISATMATLFG